MIEKMIDLFSPKTVVGLHVEEKYIRAVEISNPLHSPAVERVALLEIGDEEKIDQELASLLEREKLSAELVITSIPSSWASVREIAIPIDNPKKLSKVVKYQFEPYVPQPVESMVVDHVPGGPGKPILVFGVEKDALSRHLQALQRANLDPGIVTVDAAALYGLCLRLKEDAGGAVAIIYMGRRETTLLVVNRGRAELLRILPGGTDSRLQINQTLDLYGLKNPGDPLRRILLTGPGATDGSLARELASKSGLDVDLWRPLDRLKHTLGEVTPETQAGFAAPLAVALGSFAAPLTRFNLRREEFAPRSSADLKGPLGYMAAAVLILAALVTFGTFQKLHISQRDYTALRSQVLTVFKATCPDTPNIIKGMELEQMRQKIGEATREYQWLDLITSRGPVLDVILLLSKNLSGFKDIKLDNVSLEGKRVDLDGSASSFQTVDHLKGALEKSSAFTQIKLVSAKMDNKDKLVRFSFVMERQV